jgi:hypothetical protein
LDNPLHVILNKSKLAYRIYKYVILIANKELIKKYIDTGSVGHRERPNELDNEHIRNIHSLSTVASMIKSSRI